MVKSRHFGQNDPGTIRIAGVHRSLTDKAHRSVAQHRRNGARSHQHSRRQAAHTRVVATRISSRGRSMTRAFRPNERAARMVQRLCEVRLALRVFVLHRILCPGTGPDGACDGPPNRRAMGKKFLQVVRHRARLSGVPVQVLAPCGQPGRGNRPSTGLGPVELRSPAQDIAGTTVAEVAARWR